MILRLCGITAAASHDGMDVDVKDVDVDGVNTVVRCHFDTDAISTLMPMDHIILIKL